MCTWGTSHPVASPDTPNIWALLALSGAYCSRTLPGALTACSRQWLLVVAVDTEFRIPFPIAGAQEDTRFAIAVDKYGYLVSSTPHSQISNPICIYPHNLEQAILFKIAGNQKQILVTLHSCNKKYLNNRLFHISCELSI